MKSGIAVISLCVTCLLLGQNEPQQPVQISHTEHMDFPSGGTLRFENSIGELTVEGWDQPGVEISTIKSSKAAYSPQDREKALQELDRVQIATKREGDELVVTTEFARGGAISPPLPGSANFNLEYRVKAPRSARLIVHHNAGEVHVDDIAGNIHVTARQGEITLHLAGERPRSIDAKSNWGSVISDFPGKATRRRWLVGHQFVQGSSPGSQDLYLRIGYGDILILKASKPPYPPPVT